jgi:hypothetical protein
MIVGGEADPKPSPPSPDINAASKSVHLVVQRKSGPRKPAVNYELFARSCLSQIFRDMPAFTIENKSKHPRFQLVLSTM